MEASPGPAFPETLRAGPTKTPPPLSALPPNLDTPEEVELRQSGVATNQIGAWCKKAIPEGTTFSPFKGEKLTEFKDDTDPNYVWEIADLKTKEFLFLIDATHPESSNWMRYVHCASYFEEQNIISEQEGIDILYRAIKNIDPGEELLTWYEKTHSTKGHKRRGRKPAEKMKSLAESGPGEASQTNGNESDAGTKTKKRPPNKPSPLILDSTQGDAHEKEEEEEEGEENEDDFCNDLEQELDEAEDGESGSGSNDLKDEAGLGTPASSSEPGKFQFVLKKHHSAKSRHGRKVYKCDICSGVYRHAFSLKRHYIRNHINLKYVSRADIMNCQINPEMHDLVLASMKVQDAGSDQVNGDSVTKPQIKLEEDNGKEDANKPDSDPQPLVHRSLDEERDGRPEATPVDSDNKVADHTPSPEDALVCDKSADNAEKRSDSPDKSDSELSHCVNPRESSIKMEDEPGDIQSCDTASETPVVESQKAGKDSNISKSVIKSFSMPGLYRCNVCNDILDDLYDLKSHITNHPNVPTTKAFACDQCDMKFSHKQNLMRHLAVHTGEKPFTCKFCGKKFPTATNQKRHERIHLGRRVNCDYCSSTFTQSGDLKKHIRKLHPECFHECAFCGKYYTDAEELSEHVVTHDETLRSNEAEGNRRRDAFRVDMEMDRIESMRLAEQKTPGFKFACTVCKKHFHDYANMCRHRRLAHQRHILTGRGSDPSSPIPSPTNLTADMLDGDPQCFFYANVAQNISENLKYYIEGTQEQLENPAQHIRWRNRAAGSSKDARPKLAEPPKENSGFSAYNFPPGFTLKQNYRKIVETKIKKGTAVKNLATVIETKPTANLNGVSLNVPVFTAGSVTKREVKVQPICTVQPIQRQVPDSSIKQLSPTTVTLCVKQTLKPGAKQAASGTGKMATPSAKQISPPSGKQSVPPVGNAVGNTARSSLKVPQFHVCSVCRRVFNNDAMFQEHMMEKHKTNAEVKSEEVPKDKSPSIKATVKLEMESRFDSPLDLSGRLSSSPPKPVKPKPLTKIPTTKDKAPEQDARLLLDFALGICGDLKVTETKKAQVPMPLDLSASPDDSSQKADSKHMDVKPDVKVSQSEAMPGPVPPAHGGNRLAKVRGLLRVPSYTATKNIPPPVPMPPIMPQSPWQPNLFDSRVGAGHKKYICKVCFAEYRNVKALYAHQGEAHGNVSCNHVEVDVDVDALWWSRPSPVGMLNICSSQVPDHVTDPQLEFSCTKCQKSFNCIEELHKHIVECAVISEKNEEYSQKSLQSLTPKIEDTLDDTEDVAMDTNVSVSDMATEASALQSEKVKIKKIKSSILKRLKQKRYEQDNMKKPRRNFELLYNPQNHVRRREMTEVLDMHRCRGCDYRFATISLLERHIRVCTHKDRLKAIQMSRTLSVEGGVEQVETKHLCRYCDKPFTYPGSLRKHVLDVCPVRKALVESSKSVDVDWEQDMLAQCATSAINKDSLVGLPEGGATDVQADDAVSVATSTSSRDTEIDGSGVRRKRKGKRKNHGWGNVKKKRTSSDGADFTPELVDDSWLPDVDSDDNALVIDEDAGCDVQSTVSSSDCSNNSTTDPQPNNILDSSLHSPSRPQSRRDAALIHHIDRYMYSPDGKSVFPGEEPCIDGLRMLSESAHLISNFELASALAQQSADREVSKSTADARKDNQSAALTVSHDTSSANQNTGTSSSCVSKLGIQENPKITPGKDKKVKVKIGKKVKLSNSQTVRMPGKVKKAAEPVKSKPVVLCIPQLAGHMQYRGSITTSTRTVKPQALLKDKLSAPIMSAKLVSDKHIEENKPTSVQQNVTKAPSSKSHTESESEGSPQRPAPVVAQPVRAGPDAEQGSNRGHSLKNMPETLNTVPETIMSDVQQKLKEAGKSESEGLTEVEKPQMAKDIFDKLKTKVAFGTRTSKIEQSPVTVVDHGPKSLAQQGDMPRTVDESDPSLLSHATTPKDKVERELTVSVLKGVSQKAVEKSKEIKKADIEMSSLGKVAEKMEGVKPICPVTGGVEAMILPTSSGEAQDVSTPSDGNTNVGMNKIMKIQNGQLEDGTAEGDENDKEKKDMKVSEKASKKENNLSDITPKKNKKKDASGAISGEVNKSSAVIGLEENMDSPKKDKLNKVGIRGVPSRETVLEAREFIDSSDEEGFVVEIEKRCKKPKGKASKLVIVKVQVDPPPPDISLSKVDEKEVSLGEEQQKGTAPTSEKSASSTTEKLKGVKRSKAKCKTKKAPKTKSEDVQNKTTKKKKANPQKMKVMTKEGNGSCRHIATKVKVGPKKKKAKKAVLTPDQEHIEKSDAKTVRSKRTSTSVSSVVSSLDAPQKRKGKQKLKKADSLKTNPDENLKSEPLVDVKSPTARKKKTKVSAQKTLSAKMEVQIEGEECSGTNKSIDPSNGGSALQPQPTSKKVEVAAKILPKSKETRQGSVPGSPVKATKKRARGRSLEVTRLITELENMGDASPTPVKKSKRNRRTDFVSSMGLKRNSGVIGEEKESLETNKQTKKGKGGKLKAVPKTRASPGKSSRNMSSARNLTSQEIPAKTLRSRVSRSST